jgi:hypothetical protein
MKRSIWFMGLIAVFTNTIYATIVAQQSLSGLEQTADLIVVGSASGSFQPGSPANFSLNVARVVKGEPTVAGTTLAFRWNTTGISGLMVQPGDTIHMGGTGILFLQRSTSGWSLLPVMQGATPFEMTYFPAPASPIPSIYAYSTTASLNDKLASELSAAIESLNGNYNPELYGLFSGELDQLNSPVIQVLYQRLSTAASVQQQILGLSGLIRSGSGGALASAGGATASVFNSYALEYGILLSSNSRWTSLARRNLDRGAR